MIEVMEWKKMDMEEEGLQEAVVASEVDLEVVMIEVLSPWMWVELFISVYLIYVVTHLRNTCLCLKLLQGINIILQGFIEYFVIASTT